MRILVVGAGGIGGYFGGRLLAKGRDVTFLVRPRRAALLAEKGLTVISHYGDLHFPKPPTVTTDAIRQPADLIILSCKAYDLEGAMDSFAPAVGPKTAILPLLNGMSHLDRLEQRFGSNAVLGGQCHISVTLDGEGRVLHLNETHVLTYGERSGERTERIQAVAAQFADCGFDARLSDAVLQEMWEKWVFIASLAGITCLMRASIGDIVEAGAADLALGLYDECSQVAADHGHAPRPGAVKASRATLSQPGSILAASMMRDVEAGGAIEGEHIIGELARKAGQRSTPLLSIAHAHIKAYDARKAREAKAAG